jgi:hypothetical protein
MEIPSIEDVPARYGRLEGHATASRTIFAVDVRTTFGVGAAREDHPRGHSRVDDLSHTVDSAVVHLR